MGLVWEASGEEVTRPDETRAAVADEGRDLDERVRFQYQRVALDDGVGNVSYGPVDYTPAGQRVDLPQNARFTVEFKEIVYEVWRTMTDSRVTAGCRVLHGQVNRVGAGPYPPLHPGCRCYRAYHHSEWVSRDTVGGGRVYDI